MMQYKVLYYLQLQCYNLKNIWLKNKKKKQQEHKQAKQNR